MTNVFGDFQTPSALVSAVLSAVGVQGGRWPRVLEPTCGVGNFVAGLLALNEPPREIKGIEVQASHLVVAQRLTQQADRTLLDLQHADLFDLHLQHDLQWQHTGPLLVIGNPPWITSAELGALGSFNLPSKTNIKGLRGLDAITGGANFDIAEYIWLKLINELATQQPKIALLCKTTVARNVLLFAAQIGLPISGATIHKINARQWFDAAVDACLFQVDVGGDIPCYNAQVFADLASTEHESMLSVSRGQFVADTAAYAHAAFADGACQLTWRQGIKHDAADVMELTLMDGVLRNKLGEIVDVEDEYVYPLLKSTDLFHGRLHPLRRAVVTQHRLGADTQRLRLSAPRLWSYLQAHHAVFEQRRSSIYRSQPPFAMFGVGSYTFAPYKVAISGLHKTPQFRVVGPANGRPVVLDDTCYFVPCATAQQAALIASLLQTNQCSALLRALTFTDAKRPITKKLLQRIDLVALLRHSERSAIIQQANHFLEPLTMPDGQVTTAWPDQLETLLANQELGDAAPPGDHQQLHLGLVS